MTEAFEVSNQGGQAWPDQAAALDHGRQAGVMDLAAVGAPTRHRAVSLDLERHHAGLDLLDDADVVTSRAQAVPALGADLQDVVVRGRGQQFRRRHRAFVLAMSGLATDVPFVLSGWRRGLGVRASIT
jgi:hypothetical protein